VGGSYGGQGAGASLSALYGTAFDPFEMGSGGGGRIAITLDAEIGENVTLEAKGGTADHAGTYGTVELIS
jgi:hypothetical protein